MTTSVVEKVFFKERLLSKREEHFGSSSILLELVNPYENIGHQWIQFIEEMKKSQKFTTEQIDVLRGIAGVCVGFMISPIFLICETDVLILDKILSHYTSEEIRTVVKGHCSPEFFQTLSAGILARVEYWETSRGRKA